MGLVVRIRTRKNPDVTYTQPEIILWGAAEITTGLICVCLPPLAALVHPRHNRGQRTYSNVHSHDGRQTHRSRRVRPESLEEADLFTRSSDVELQYNGAAPGVVTFPRPLIAMDISTRCDARKKEVEKRERRNGRVEVLSEKAGGEGRIVDATTAIRSERYYL